jgi:hypothetical protein
MDDNENPNGQRRRETLLAFLLTGFLAGAFLLFMVLITGGFFLRVLAVVAVIGIVGYAHYLLWGHSLTQEVAGEREQEEERERWENETSDSPETFTQQRF